MCVCVCVGGGGGGGWDRFSHKTILAVFIKGVDSFLTSS